MGSLSRWLVLGLGLTVLHCLLPPVSCRSVNEITGEEAPGDAGDIARQLELRGKAEPGEEEEERKGDGIVEVGMPLSAPMLSKLDPDLGYTLQAKRDRSRSRSRSRFVNAQGGQRMAVHQGARGNKKPVQVGINRGMAKMIVGLHNNYRRTAPGTAANMEEMKWDEDLTTMASDYAKKCIWGHGNPENITPYQHVGQNLAYSRGGAPSSPLYLISHWYNEKKNYDIRTDACLPDTVCGHYTQIVWAQTNRIGCAMHLCPVLRDPEGPTYNNAQLLVCNYGPGGNLNGHVPYQLGEPCSLCASGLGNCKNGLCSECSLVDPNCGCNLECQNGGSINADQCKCDCPPGWTGTLCQNVCNNTHPWCGDGWPKQWCFEENDANPVEQLCPALCGVCECGGPDCENGGTRNPDSCMCECVTPWSGPTCGECNIQCVHGKMDRDSCHCACDDGWMGDSCADRCENTNKKLCHRGWYPNWCDDEHPYVLKYCQAMCGLCNPVMSAAAAEVCHLTCQNGGVLDSGTCTCECADGWSGEDCTAACRNEFQYCDWVDANMCEENDDFATNYCPLTCGKCTPIP